MRSFHVDILGVRLLPGGAPEHRPREGRTFDIGARKRGTLKIRAVESELAEGCLIEARPSQIRRGQAGPGEARAGGVGAVQVRAAEIDVMPLGSREIDA